ncbi:MAG TPA: DUF4157 domain-containing protein [Thermoanaerobaculia bacterium]|nr:DUF4157 domain-containing protein [Thermoanaerobaculia bacterium]
MARAFPPIQAKLTVNTPGDAYEQEADRMADLVMRAPAEPVGQISGAVQRRIYRAVMRPEDKYDSMLPAEEEATATPSQGQPSPGAGAAEQVQRSAVGEAGAVSPQFQRSLESAVAGGGETLPGPTRSFMGDRFGRDFSSVRVHSDSRADTLSRRINARAFTLGNNVFFARSQYQPGTAEGQRLLAHELTHVVQQSENRVARQIQRTTRCSSYPGYDASVSLAQYNCAGLALRTYQWHSPPSAVISAMAANFINPQSSARGSCAAGKVKFWLWEYRIHLEDDQGNILPQRDRNGRVFTHWSDFHIVGGRTDALGRDPAQVYTKNGARRVHGPGTGPSFRPAPRDRALSNDAAETPGTTPQGRPVFKVRDNMTENITCAQCHP